MINFALSLLALIITSSVLNASTLMDNVFFQKGRAAQQSSLIPGAVNNSFNLDIPVDKHEYYLSQISEDSSFYIELSYNSDKSEYLTKEILSKALREMTTTFIGSGFTYVSKEQADLIAKVYIDAEISDYKQGGAKTYDFLCKVTIKLYGKNDKLIKESNKNIFLSGQDLDQLAISSISKSSLLAAKDIVTNLIEEKSTDQKVSEIATKVKIELLFEGGANFKFFETVNNLIKNSSTKLKVLKRTIQYGNSINLLVLSTLESQRLAEHIIDHIPNKDSLEVTSVTENKVVFRIK